MTGSFNILHSDDSSERTLFVYVMFTLGCSKTYFQGGRERRDSRVRLLAFGVTSARYINRNTLYCTVVKITQGKTLRVTVGFSQRKYN